MVAYPAMMNVDGRIGVLVNGYGAQLGRLDLKVDIAGKKVRSAEWKKITIDAKLEPAIAEPLSERPLVQVEFVVPGAGHARGDNE